MATRLLRDILREPAELKKTLERMLGPGRGDLERAAAIAREAKHVTFAGIGASWCAGAAALSISERLGLPARLTDASEILPSVQLPPGEAIVALSRSGKSVEITALVGPARAAGARVIGITNAPESPLATGADAAILLGAPFDHSISITMYSAVALGAGLLVRAAAGALDEPLGRGLAEALDATAAALPGWRERIERSGWFDAGARVYFLGRAGSLASASNARLLWEEGAKMPATAMTTGSFRHGTQEVVSPGLRVGLWIDPVERRVEDLALAKELRAHGVQVMVVGHALPQDAGDLVLEVPEIPTGWQFLIDIIPAQLAAERLARLRGVDPDSFRLASYVVESDQGLSGRLTPPDPASTPRAPPAC
jgi:fructoselysine-6-P-deglycase FrlB-like protein